MPQFDRRRMCQVPIEFEACADLSRLPHKDRVALFLATDGKAVLEYNGETKTLAAPFVMCLSADDMIKEIDCAHLYAQLFNLNPAFIKNRFPQDPLSLFYERDGNYNGILPLPEQTYIKVLEWMGIIGTEISAQSDGRWTCRVRAYFLRILNLLEALHSSGAISTDAASTPVDEILEYLHVHYMDNIRLDDLCRMTHVNRTTLNRRFKQRTGQTVIDYLLSCRLRVATELLAHTGLTLDEIARATGFAYDTYLIRQFESKTGQTPTAYRQAARKKHGIVIPPK